MKKYFLLLPAALTGILLMAQTGSTAKLSSEGCTSCADAPRLTVAQYVVLSDGEKHLMISGCVPFSDVEVYSTASGGVMVNNAVAGEKGEAEIVLPAKMPAAFVINHNHVNAAGIAGSGHVSFLGAPLLELNDVEVNASGSYVQIACKAAAGVSGLQLVVERSNGRESAVVYTQPMEAGGAPRYVPVMENVKAISQNGMLTYTVKVVNADGQTLFSKNKSVAVPQSTWAEVVPTAFTGPVTIRIPADKVPADYTVFDLSGKQVLQRGKVTAQNQQVQVNVQPGQYLMQVTDGKGNSSTEKIIRQ